MSFDLPEVYMIDYLLLVAVFHTYFLARNPTDNLPRKPKAFSRTERTEQFFFSGEIDKRP